MAASMKFRVFWDILPCSQAARTSEMSVGIDLTTWQYIPEYTELNTVSSSCNGNIWNSAEKYLSDKSFYRISFLSFTIIKYEKFQVTLHVSFMDSTQL
jgi:hypothetical protein